MSNDLRTKLIRLAHQNPDIRADLLPLLKEAGWEDGDALKLKLVASFPNEEEGTEGRVFDLGHQGFSAMLFDVDSGNTVGGRIYPREMKQKALAYAEKMALGGGGGVLHLAGGMRDNKKAEWKGWNEVMPVQVVTKSGQEVFKNLAAAQKKYPDLDPKFGGGGFYGAMHGEINGRPAIRFESHEAYKMYSMASGKTASMTTMLALPIKEAAILLAKTLSGGAYPVEALSSFKVVVETCTMFARRGVIDPILTKRFLQAQDRLVELIEARSNQRTEDPNEGYYRYREDRAGGPDDGSEDHY